MKTIFPLAFSLLAFACGETPAPARSDAPVVEVAASSPDGATPQAVLIAQVPAGAVARIVFLDQEKCCPCSQKRIDDGWSRLQAAMDYKPTVPIERVHVDTEMEKSKPYTAMKQAIIAPAIYFLDRDGKLLDMVQGEVTEEALRQQLARGR